MDVSEIAAFLKDGGPWGLVAICLVVIKVLYDRTSVLQDKVESGLNEWRKDSQAQSDKLASILERAARDDLRR